jgi:predicted extracellular nuclease
VASAQALEIFEIQGPGMSSPHEGDVVTTTRNVVTAVGSEGFFIQTPDSRDDGNPNTSNGVYVADVSPEVQVGFLVDVTALVVEFFEWTQLHEPEVTLRSTGLQLPEAVRFDAQTPSPDQPWPANELERFEGMRVRVSDGTLTSPSDGFGDACVVAKPDRVFREPGILYPGLDGLPVFDGNPEAFEIAPGGLDGGHTPLVAGASVSAEGVLAFEFGEYRLWPVEMSVSNIPQLPQPVRSRRSGEIAIGSQNVERLDSASDEPPFDVRLAKLSGQIREVLGSPDILAIQEVQDMTTLAALAQRVRTDDPSVRYTPIHREAPWADGFDVAFLVRDSVEIVSVEQIGADVRFSYDQSLLNDRPPLVLEGVYRDQGYDYELTVVVVHQRSLRNIDDPSDGERVRQKRHEQAVWLAQWLQQRQIADPDEKIIVAGDFNAFEFTDGYVDVMGQVTGAPDPRGALIPVEHVLAPPLATTAWDLPDDGRYTYIFDCSAQVLDHIVVSTAVAPWVAAVSASRGNADAPEAWEDNPETAARSSDHDGLVLYLGQRWRRPAGRRYAP